MKFLNKTTAISALIIFLAGCAVVLPEDVPSLTDDQLCEYSGPRWTFIALVDAAMRREIASRDLRCYDGIVVSESKQQEPVATEKGPSSGSGVIVNINGYVLTNDHVIAGCSSLEVIIESQPIPAFVHASDSVNDVAVLKINRSTPNFAKIRHSSRVRLAEPVMVLGYPLRGILADQMNATSGDVTSLAGLKGDSRFIQISAPVQPGNSGGPIVDESGAVIGLATSKLNALRVAQATGDIPQNINFGVKSATAINFLDSAGVEYNSTNKGLAQNSSNIVDQLRDAVVTVLCD